MVPLVFGRCQKKHSICSTTVKTRCTSRLSLFCRYFQNLANVANNLPEATPPAKEQLRLLLERCSKNSQLTPEQMGALAGQVNIAKSIVAKVLQVGAFPDMVEVDKFIFLLLAMSCESFAGVLQGLFDVFGNSISSDRFQTLIAYLAPDMDPDITSQFLSDVSTALLEVEKVSYDNVAAIPCIAAKL